jgi:hypothetical protein
MRRLHSKILASFFILAPIFTLPISACKSRAENESRVKVVNGTDISANGFPAVVRIAFEQGNRSAMCTATWVSDRVLLTAAHCVEGADRSPNRLSVVDGTGTGQRAIRVISHPTYTPDCGNCYDIAVAVFKEKASPFYIPVALTQAQVGDPLTIIGYGNINHLTQKGSGTKRQGTNKVSAIDYRGRVDFVGLMEPSGNEGKGTGIDVTNSQGDSGGPMLIKSRVQGVSSSVNTGPNNRNVGHYESVRAPAVSAWLTKLAASGVYILGFSAGTESITATDTTVNGGDSDTPVTPPIPSNNDEVPPPAPQVEPDVPGTPDPQPAPNPTPKPLPSPAPGGGKLLDCNRDYVKIRQGGQGVCQNSSSGFCYRYSGGDVRYSEGRTNCAASGSPGAAAPGATPGVTPTPKPSTILDCNGNYSQIRAGGSGVCRNRTSGFCYRYSGGDVRYSLGRVSCP